MVSLRNTLLLSVIDMELNVPPHSISKASSHDELGVRQRFVHESVKNIIELSMHKRYQANAITLDKAAVEVGNCPANESLNAQIDQFLGAIEKRVVFESLAMQLLYFLAFDVQHEHLSG